MSKTKEVPLPEWLPKSTKYLTNFCAFSNEAISLVFRELQYIVYKFLKL